MAYPPRTYKPCGNAKEFMYCHDKAILYSGTVASGKTVAALHKAYICCEKFPGTRVLLLRRHRASLSQTTLDILERFVFPVGHPAMSGATKENRQSYKFANGSEIICGNGEHWSRIMGASYTFIIVDEANELDEEQFTSLLTRCNREAFECPIQQVIALCNPQFSSHWLITRAKAGKITLIQAKMEDNPTLWDESKQEWTKLGREYRDTLLNLSPTQYDRMVKGLWVSAEGLIFPEFLPAMVIEPIPLDQRTNWTVVGSVDTGWNDPNVLQVWGKDKQGMVYLIKEFLKTEFHIDTFLAKIKDFKLEFGIQDFVGDPSNKPVIEWFGKQNLRIRPANKDRKLGIQCIKRRMRSGKFRIFKDYQATVDPTLARKHKATCFLDEIASYVWDTKNPDEPEPRQQEDAIDTARYGNMYFEDASDDVLCVLSHDEDEDEGEELPDWLKATLARSA